jgi:tetratricopeptide (TPR) repeat protein
LETHFGRYAVTSEIYRGNASVVFRAVGPDGAVVAIKLLPSAAIRPDAVLRERRLLATLGKEDGFVPLLDAGDSRQGPYLVSPFLPGGTLRDRLSKGRLSIDETILLGRALASAAARAHALGIVHRDLKPENVLYDAQGTPLVADLGIAKHYRFAPDARSVSISTEGELRGTIGFMSPEQMRDAKSVGPAADVFAIGAILQECLTGEPAFAGGTVLEVLANVEADRRLPLRKARPDAPPWLVAAIDRALRPDPRLRFPDGAALRDALEAPESRARRIPVIAVIAAVLVGLGIALAAVLLRQDPPSVPATVVQRSQAELALERRKRIDDGVAEARGHRLHALESYHRSGETSMDEELARASAILEGLGEPDDPAVALEVAEIALDHEPATAATLAVAEHARAVGPRDPMAHALAGEVLLRLGKLEEASRTFEAALELDPRLPRARSGRAQVMKAQKDPGAHAALSAVIAADPGDTSARYARIQCSTDAEEALSDMNELVAREPAVVGWRRMRERMLLQAHRDLETARADVDFLIHANMPNIAALWLERAGISVALGDTKGALADLDQAERLDPAGPVGGNARQLRGRIEKR